MSKQIMDWSFTNTFKNTVHFPKKGIISYNGSLLSYLAIVARESKIPVIKGVNLELKNLKPGDLVEINDQLAKFEKSNS